MRRFLGWMDHFRLPADAGTGLAAPVFAVTPNLCPPSLRVGYENYAMVTVYNNLAIAILLDALGWWTNGLTQIAAAPEARKTFLQRRPCPRLLCRCAGGPGVSAQPGGIRAGQSPDGLPRHHASRQHDAPATGRRSAREVGSAAVLGRSAGLRRPVRRIGLGRPPALPQGKGQRRHDPSAGLPDAGPDAGLPEHAGVDRTARLGTRRRLGQDHPARTDRPDDHVASCKRAWPTRSS